MVRHSSLIWFHVGSMPDRNCGTGMLVHAMVLILAINKLCVVRGARSDAALKFPDHGVTYRGGALPDEHQAFFTVGKKYRVPGFLATSFNESVAERFIYMAYADGSPCIKWVVHVDERGAADFKYRCKHVNYVESSNFAVRSLDGPRSFLRN